MKTILITGINGFLGSHLALQLKKQFNVIGLEYSLDNLFRVKDEQFNIYSSKNSLETIFKQNEVFAIIHAATLYNRENTPITDVLKTNVLLPIELYTLAITNNVKIFINTDSFFNNPKYNYSYLQDYTLSKRHSIEWLKLMQTPNCKVVSLKIFHMYGINDALSKFVPMMISRLKSNESFINTTYGEQTRDFIYIEDVVLAFEVILQSINNIPLKFTEYEVGTGKSNSIKQLMLSIKDITESKTEIKFGMMPYRENEIMNSVADNSSLIKLGWKPRYQLMEGLKKTIFN